MLGDVVKAGMLDEEGGVVEEGEEREEPTPPATINVRFRS